MLAYGVCNTGLLDIYDEIYLVKKILENVIFNSIACAFMVTS